MLRIKSAIQTLGVVALSIGLAAPAIAEHVTIPPAVYRVWPVGLERGTTATFTIEGRNLNDAKVLFDSPGLTAKVVSLAEIAEPKRVARPGLDTGALVPQGTKEEVKIEVTAAKDAEPRVHRFRLLTPLGTSNMAVLDVGALPEVMKPEGMKKDWTGGTPQAQPVELPATLVGTLAKPGETDTFGFTGKQGEELVFQVVASELGSNLTSALTLRDDQGRTVAQSENTESADAVLTAKLPAGGKYSITIADREKGGSMDHFYRLNAGALPYLTGVYPLGVHAGRPAEVEVRGVNLGGAGKLKVEPPASASGWTTVPVAVKTAQGESVNRLRLAVSDEPEVDEKEPNNSVAEAQTITVPVTINGTIGSGQAGDGAGAARTGAGDEDYFRFHAAQGQRLIVEVAAARLGSPLDSVIDVLDAQGRDIPRATIRCLA